MKVITFITENNFQIDFEKNESGLYKPLIEYCGEYEYIPLLLSFKDVLKVMEEWDDLVHIEDQTMEMVKMIVSGYFRIIQQRRI